MSDLQNENSLVEDMSSDNSANEQKFRDDIKNIVESIIGSDDSKNDINKNNTEKDNTSIAEKEISSAPRSAVISQFSQNSQNNQNSSSDDEVEIDLGELFYYFRSHLLSIIALFIVGALLAGVLVYYFITPKYTATTKLYMVSSSSKSVVDISDFNIGTSLSQDYVEVIKTRPVYETVNENLGLNYTYEDLDKMITTSVVGDTRIVQIDVEDEDAKEASDIANEIAAVAVDQIPKTMETSEPHIIEPAIVPEEPSSPHLLRDIVLGGLIGMVLMLVILTISFVSDDTFQSGEDVESVFGVMPLTVIPESDIGVLNEKYEKDDDDRKNRRKAKAKTRGRKKSSKRAKSRKR